MTTLMREMRAMKEKGKPNINPNSLHLQSSSSPPQNLPHTMSMAEPNRRYRLPGVVWSCEFEHLWIPSEMAARETNLENYKTLTYRIEKDGFAPFINACL
ncbi:hypothetical protein E3N88_23614 [Mikania micrantha]|uniref:Uncharacterized protein n=1 Tax=Mikania micrantha TaxID=192012 RepID=A0A5N6NFH7_9ASTR|nr:hypothetical protein E3N88_23614 [Mikania micrantha]